MLKYLAVNIRQFEDEDDFSKYVVDGEIDVESLVTDYTTSQQGNENHDDVDTEKDEIPEETPEVTDPEPETDPDPEQTPPPKNTPDQAFAQMRRQVEQYEPIAKWVQDLAAQQGFKDPQELINAFQQRQLEQEAEAKGVPVDVYQRLHQLEQENKTHKDTLKSQQFNAEVETTKAKYNLNDDQLTEVFRYMGQNGYDAGDISFEDAYVLSNRETLIKEAEERGRQSYLEEKRKQQTNATPNAGTGAEDGKKGDSLDYSSDGILNTFKEMGIPID